MLILYCSYIMRILTLHHGKRKLFKIVHSLHFSMYSCSLITYHWEWGDPHQVLVNENFMKRKKKWENITSNGLLFIIQTFRYRSKIMHGEAKTYVLTDLFQLSHIRAFMCEHWMKCLTLDSLILGVLWNMTIKKDRKTTTTNTKVPHTDKSALCLASKKRSLSAGSQYYAINF